MKFYSVATHKALPRALGFDNPEVFSVKIFQYAVKHEIYYKEFLPDVSLGLGLNLIKDMKMMKRWRC